MFLRGVDCKAAADCFPGGGHPSGCNFECARGDACAASCVGAILRRQPGQGVGVGSHESKSGITGAHQRQASVRHEEDASRSRGIETGERDARDTGDFDIFSLCISIDRLCLLSASSRSGATTVISCLTCGESREANPSCHHFVFLTTFPPLVIYGLGGQVEMLAQSPVPAQPHRGSPDQDAEWEAMGPKFESLELAYARLQSELEAVRLQNKELLKKVIATCYRFKIRQKICACLVQRAFPMPPPLPVPICAESSQVTYQRFCQHVLSLLRFGHLFIRSSTARFPPWRNAFQSLTPNRPGWWTPVSALDIACRPFATTAQSRLVARNTMISLSLPQ